MSDVKTGKITITIGEEQASPDLGTGWRQQCACTRIEPEDLARTPHVLMYSAEAAGLLSRLFADRLQRPGLVRRMTVTLEVDG